MANAYVPVQHKICDGRDPHGRGSYTHHKACGEFAHQEQSSL
jgi:hypothetical protein